MWSALAFVVVWSGSACLAECGLVSFGLGVARASGGVYPQAEPVAVVSGECGGKSRFTVRGLLMHTRFDGNVAGSDGESRYVSLDTNGVCHVAFSDEDHPGFFLTAGLSVAHYGSHEIRTRDEGTERLFGFNGGFGLEFGSPAHVAPVRLEFLYRVFTDGDPRSFFTGTLGVVF